MLRANSLFSGKDAKSGLSVRVSIAEKSLPTETVVQSLKGVNGEMIFWYEGMRGLTESSARYMTDSLLRPIYEVSQDATFILYSLRGWDFDAASIGSKVEERNDIGSVLNNANLEKVMFLNSVEFFSFCLAGAKNEALAEYCREMFADKPELLKLSAKRKTRGMTVSSLFSGRASLLQGIYDMDVVNAYVFMQYLEGYFLIRESIQRQMKSGKRDIAVTFVLPNDEGKYYMGLDADLINLLRLDMGGEIDCLSVKVDFRFFRYGKCAIERPYIDRAPDAVYVQSESICKYFGFLRSRGGQAIDRLESASLKKIVF